MAGRPYRGPFDPFEGGSFQGFPDIQIPRPPRRFWIGLGFVAAAVLVVLLSRPLVGVLTEIQWFTAIGYRNVYVTQVLLQIWLFCGVLVVSFCFAGVNAAVALRMRGSGALRAVGIRRRTLRTGAGALALSISAAMALILAGGIGTRWMDFALFLHPAATGTKDPVFGLDVGFYLLQLPFLYDVLSWSLGLLFMVLLLTTGIYAWRGSTVDLRLTGWGLAHISVLMAGLAMAVGASAFFGRYSLVYGHDSVVWGAGYTDVHVRVGMALAQTVLAGLLAVVLLVNAFWWRRPQLLPGAIGIWFLMAIVSVAYPALIQRVVVQPAELALETPYIQHQIQFTRQAFGLDQVQVQSYGGNAPVTAQEVARDQATIQNLRLWDNSQILQTYQQLQSIRTYYNFDQINVDRYTINGRTVQVAIAAREMNQSALPPQAQNWYNETLIYTHGYGVAASPVSAVVGEGLPDYVVGNIPPSGSLKVTRPQIYFGEQTNNYVIVDTRQPEFDYPTGAANAHTFYDSSLGVRLNGANRLLWSLRTGDFNMYISDQLTPQSQLLFRRNVQARIQAVAPFLEIGDSPYPVVYDGQIYWIQDAYTGASTYPYSQSYASIGGQNYLRNSVKAVVNAYTGAVTLYVATPQDPLIRAWERTFPGLFRPLSQMPRGLLAHIRVPQTLFTVQAEVYSLYHMTDAATFYNREDVWAMPLQPYYVEMRLPNENQTEYLQIIPFTPLNKQNLVSWLAVRNDPPHYGQMISYVLPKGRVVFGPQQVASRIQQTPDISRDRTLLNSQGSQVIQGNLLAVPIGDSFLYFEPWYLRSTANGQGLPELKKVIVTDASDTSSVAYQNTLGEALAQLTGISAASTSSSSSTAPATLPAQVNSLVAQALQDYNTAQSDLKSGNLNGYAQEMSQVASLLQQVQALTGTKPTTPSPSPTS
jgi:uncharacterized membrane protein (UPF0182 family)